MSMLTTIPRNAVRLGLAVAGTPARIAGSPPWADRADARVRELAGRLLGDDALLDEAQRKRVAAGERRAAERLGADATARQRRAAKTAEQRREAAHEQADREEAAALKRREKALDAESRAVAAEERADRLAEKAGRLKEARTR